MDDKSITLDDLEEHAMIVNKRFKSEEEGSVLQ